MRTGDVVNVAGGLCDYQTVVWCADRLLENKVHSLKLVLLKIGIYLQARHIDRHVVVYCEEFIDPFTTCSDTCLGTSWAVHLGLNVGKG